MTFLLGFAILGWVMAFAAIALSLFRLYRLDKLVDELHDEYSRAIKKATADVAHWKKRALVYKNALVEDGLMDVSDES